MECCKLWVFIEVDEKSGLKNTINYNVYLLSV